VEADPATTTALLAAIREDLRQALEGSRALAQRIYPPLLEAGGLGPAVREAASRADVTVTIEGASGQELPPEIAGAIYFCSTEVIAWAGAGEVPGPSVLSGGALVIGALLVNEWLGWRGRS